MSGGLYGSATYNSSVYYGSVGDPFVELLLNGVWTDITAYVRVDQGITIGRGRTDWGQSPTFATCTMTLDNRDGRFSPRNASGAYYGYIGRNTQIRVSVFLDDGSTSVRFWGDVTEWPVTWDTTGREVTTQILACGIRRSLGKLIVTAPFESVMIATAGANLVSYWPMQDGSLATTFASALSGGAAGAITSGSGTISLASDSTSFLASTALPEFGDGSSATFNVPSYTPDATGQQVRCLAKITGASGSFLWRVDTIGAHYFLFEYAPSIDTIQWTMNNYTTGLVEYTSFAYTATPYFNTPKTGIRFGLFFKQNGTGIDVQFNTLPPGTNSGFVVNETVPSSTFGYITGITLYAGPTGGTTATIGHLTVESKASTLFDLEAVLDDYAGESAATRAQRLADEQGVPYFLVAGPVTSALMGPQPVGAFLDVFDDCAKAENGISTETVSTRSLELRKRSSMYSQTPVVTFIYTAVTVEALAPVDDDQYLVNDVTVTRTDGGSARITDTTSAVSVSAVGKYAVDYPLNLFSDSQCLDQASFRLQEGTVDKPRLSSFQFDAYTQSSSQRVSIVAMREGDVVRLTSAPAFTGLASTVDTRVLGWTETIGYRQWRFDLHGVDATVYQQVLILDDTTYGILDTDRLGL